MEELTFPTNKPHISYSELKTWVDCPLKHYNSYVLKLSEWEPSIYADFGTVVHDHVEHYLKTKEMPTEEEISKNIRALWAKNDFDSDEYINKTIVNWKKFNITYRHQKIEKWIESAVNILESFPKAMEDEFGEWEFIAAEDQLYEEMDGCDKDKIKFKGFIDAIIKTKVKGKDKYWIVDWKTCGPRGWQQDKRRDFYVQAQVGLYKKYWAKREGIPLRSIGCKFGLLKRNSKVGKCVWFLTVSVGPKFIDRVDKLTVKMISSVYKGLKLKKKNCTFCPYYQTENCK